jgi:UDP-N-acetylglucosamine 2-epimerase
MKVVTILGTRPEIIRLSRVMAALDRAVEHVVIHTGQNYDYELNDIFFAELELRPPDHYLGAAGATPAETIGQVIVKSDELLRRLAPEAVLVLGDTNSCLAAIAAKRLKIPVFHMEAGNRCFDQRVPEEINRRIIDHVADVNLPYSDLAREYLLREGLPPELVIKTGSPMFEVLRHYLPKIEGSDVLERLGLRAGEYFVLSAHRDENIESPHNFAELCRTLDELARSCELPVIVSTHPRTRKKIESEDIKPHPLVQLLRPLGLCDYVHLEMHARATLSDSGTITEEASILNFPALNIRQTHERPEGMAEAAVMMTGLGWERIREALAVLQTQGRGAERTLRLPDDYAVPNVSEKVLRIILSYVDYVNRTIWRKS